MSDIIRLLPDAIANQIAAGEVVQRPASVVKELLENSVDSGATDIKLIIKDGGQTLIQVIDNGKGMSETDARMCWERHATSKISRAEDLFALRTLGFRGEALASIASVAQVEMKSKPHTEQLGTLIQIEASEIKKQELVSAPAGTSISVKNLFYNIPARRNFLKSIPVETKHIIDDFQRVALPNPHISFSFYHNDNEVYNLPGTRMGRRISDMLGKKEDALIELSEDAGFVRISGFLGKPEIAKKTRGDQYFFVNNRFIKDPYLNHAVMGAFENILPKDAFPLYVLFIEIDPSKIDINVHPTKTEIKFEDERSLYLVVKSLVKRALGGFNFTPDFEEVSGNTFNPVSNFQPVKNFSFPSEPQIKVNKDYNPFQNDSFQKRPQTNWEGLFASFKDQDESENQIIHQTSSINHQTSQTTENRLFTSDERPVQQGKAFQLQNRYIVTGGAAGLVIIDQQAAHERILFEKYSKQLERSTSTSQHLLFPRVIEFSPSDFEILSEILTEIRILGFDLNEFGKNSFIINGTPSDISKGEAREMLEGLLENYKKNLSQPKLEKRENLARAMARNSSIKSGTQLNDSEISALVEDLFECSNPGTTPSGSPTFVTFAREEMAGWFRR